MKNRYLFLALLLGTFYTGSAQYRYTAAVWEDPNYGNLYKTPIRNWKQNYSVTFESNGTSYCVCLIDNTTFFSSPPIVYPSLTPGPPAASVYRATISSIPSGMSVHVSDIYVVDDYAFFCGYLWGSGSVTTTSFYGYLDLTDFLLYSSVTINCYLLQDDIGVAPSTLERLVAYPNGAGGYSVVAFGNEMKSCKLIEIQNATVAPVVYTYDFPISNPYIDMCKMYIDDISLDDSYVYLSGHDISSPPTNQVWYGIYDKTNIAASMGNTFFFPASEEPNGSVICTAMPGESMFALAYTYYDEIPEQWYTRIRMIDRTNGINVLSQQFKKEEKYEPLRMIYLSDLSSIELVQDNERSSEFIMINPFSGLAYNASVLTHLGYYFYNIDNIAGHHFLSAYQNYFYIQDRTMSLPASTSLCPYNQTLQVDIIPDLNSTTNPPSSPLILDYILMQPPSSVVRNSLNIDCFSYE